MFRLALQIFPSARRRPEYGAPIAKQRRRTVLKASTTGSTLASDSGTAAPVWRGFDLTQFEPALALRFRTLGLIGQTHASAP